MLFYCYAEQGAAGCYTAQQSLHKDRAESIVLEMHVLLKSRQVQVDAAQICTIVSGHSTAN